MYAFRVHNVYYTSIFTTVCNKKNEDGLVFLTVKSLVHEDCLTLVKQLNLQVSIFHLNTKL